MYVFLRVVETVCGLCNSLEGATVVCTEIKRPVGIGLKSEHCEMVLVDVYSVGGCKLVVMINTHACLVQFVMCSQLVFPVSHVSQFFSHGSQNSSDKCSV